MDDLQRYIFKLKTEQEFNELCLKIFRYQAAHNAIYNKYLSSIGVDPAPIENYREIPFLPIEFFKNHRILCGDDDTVERTFISSGTTGTAHGKHEVKDIRLYEESFTKGFHYFYGSPAHYVLIALLPSYVEQGNSSLVYMTDRLIHATGHRLSGFYLGHEDKLDKALQITDRRVLILGVTYALLDLAEERSIRNPGLIVMETGGMKGRRKEMVREEVHQILRSAFDTPAIHSEYGMTELLSQAYSTGFGIFRTPPWMKVVTREMNDPLSLAAHGKTGGLNIIDLANIHSCAFIATQDLCRTHPDGSFEVLGRFDASDVRGCNLLVE